jgi:predicted RNA-binding protein YlqC (UPF0109 family)
MSAFDDEFGLFGDEGPQEDERRSTLGARKIESGDSNHDEIEFEDARPRRTSTGSGATGSGFTGTGAGRNGVARRRREVTGPREQLPAEIAHPRATELLTFLAKKLVSKPDAVAVVLHQERNGAVLELEVDAEDLGKVIGRGGRVAQALRTLVRAGAQGRVTVDIIDVDEEEEDAEEAPEALEAAEATPNAAVPEE